MKKIRKMVLLAKIETTVGTDAVPTGAANAILASNVQHTPLEGDEVEHNYIQPYFGNQGSELVTQYSKLTFDVELSGSGTAGTAPGYAPLLRACACSMTINAGVDVTFAPVSDAIESATLYCNIDGTNHIMRSARGTFKITADPKGLPKLQFELTGLFTPLAATALPTPTYTGFAQAVGVNAANTQVALHGVTVACSAVGFDAACTVVKRDLTSVDAVEITDRKSTANLTFQNVAIGTKNWVAAALAGDEGALSIVHGTVAGNIVEINAPKAQAKKPSYSDSDGIQMIAMPLALIPSSAGGDEWEIVVR